MKVTNTPSHLGAHSYQLGFSVFAFTKKLQSDFQKMVFAFCGATCPTEGLARESRIQRTLSSHGCPSLPKVSWPQSSSERQERSLSRVSRGPKRLCRKTLSPRAGRNEARGRGILTRCEASAAVGGFGRRRKRRINGRGPKTLPHKSDKDEMDEV